MGYRETQPAFVLLILLTAFIYIATLGFNGLAGDPSASRGLFIHGIGNVSAIYGLEITPAGWTFAIWGVIYFFQAVWIAYAVSNICRRVSGGPAYTSPTILSPTFFVTFFFNCLSNIVWLFVWDREYIVAATPILGLTAVTCWLGLLIGYGGLDKVKDELKDDGRQIEVNFIRVFVFNGLALYGAWTTIATLLNLGSALAYKMEPPVPQSTTSLICLGLLAVFYVTFVILDLTVLDQYSRFTYSPYLLVLWTIAGILSKNWNPEQTSSIVVAILSGLGDVGLILKVVVSILRQRQQPLTYKSLNLSALKGNDVYPVLSVK